MQLSNHSERNTSAPKRVSTQQAVKILKRHGIQTTDEQATIILNFLYVLAKAAKYFENFNE